MGVPMIVKKEFRPGGSGSKLLKVGSSFVADSESQAKLCRAMGWCEDAPEPRAEPVTRAMQPAEDGGGYLTRAMTPFRPAAKKVAAKKTAKRDA